MENQKSNIDNALRDKFEDFAPPPPAHIWEGIEAGLAAQPKPVVATTIWKGIGIAASILLLIGFSFWWFMPKEDSGEIAEIPENTITTTESGDPGQEAITPSTAITDAEQADSENTADQKPDTELTDEHNSVIAEDQSDRKHDQNPNQPADNFGFADNTTTTNAGDTAPLSPTTTATIATPANQREGQAIYTVRSAETNVQEDLPPSSFQTNPLPPSLISGETAPSFKPGWSHGFYFTPEVLFSNFDSVDMLPVYSLGYEPTYHVSNHFFIRTGLGLSFARDRGFGQLDFTRDEVVGTYEDVYEVTFDSIDGELVPTYYTETRDVWDSVRHISISELTNKYSYLQVPLLFGYHNKGSKLNWFFYGGPAVNLMVSRSIDDPGTGLENATIWQAENRLPERSDYFMQLWFGAGIEYKFAKQMALALEPNYRYYFNHVYKNDPYRKGFSSFSLRVGIVYKVK